ncbi:MAG TPA: SDR family NAD(P)-dependent oxidoreductase [Acidimicrobiia bacterium]
MTDAASAVDRALEAPVITSFTKIGYAARRKLFHWRALDDYDLHGRIIAVTGATSGLGRAAAEQLARDGATVMVLGRNPEKTTRVAADLRAATGNDRIASVIADMGDLATVRRAAAEILATYDRLDVLIHNAGALTNARRAAPDGTEMTVASQVVGPFLLTGLLLERLVASAPARVVTVASGGMYTAELTVGSLQMDAASYNGAKQYARAKRAQVTLNELWARRFPDRSVVFHAMHPGWADTPGVEASLPTFRKVVGPLLRAPLQGADTMVWLAADDGEPLASSGHFWLDRRVRPIHRLRSTARSDTPARREELWDWVVTASGWTPPGAEDETGPSSGSGPPIE